jgi:hypothetical protein
MLNEFLDDLCSDVSYAIRGLTRNPSFTAAALITLALGIGAATAVFSVVNTVLLEPLPYHDSDRLVRIVQRAAPANPSAPLAPSGSTACSPTWWGSARRKSAFAWRLARSVARCWA